jgi:hypothetical protein
MKQWRFILMVVFLVLFIQPDPAGALEVGAAPAGLGGIPLIALTDDQTLLFFHSGSPSTIEDAVTITGVAADFYIAAIDVRPATGQLYGLGIGGTSLFDEGTLYLIDPDTGAATLVGSAPFSAGLTTHANYGFDFNPAVDRIRVVNDSDQNLRVHPDTGALVASDTALDNPAGEEDVVGLAYNRNLPGYGLTTLYGIDAANSILRLVRLGGVDGNPSPNGGLVTVIGPLGLAAPNHDVGFDIANISLAFASFLDGNFYRLYAINLNTGEASLLGGITTSLLPVLDLAVAPRWHIFLPTVLRNQ